jgi:N-acetylglucosaminyldiphosphoundecaprenol N-acetyl-beta-D-mannosaminyltransferase
MTTDVSAIPVRRLFGIPIHAARQAEVLAACQSAIESGHSLTIGVVNAAKIVAMQRDRRLYDAVCGCDLILADGMAVVWASRLLRQPLPERIAGIDLFERLLRVADEKHFSVFFLGAAQDVLDELLLRVHRTYPAMRVVGCRNGYFREEESGSVAAQIRQLRPDMLFVAMSSPRKETFLGRWGSFLNVRVCHGVGGSFDVLAGKVKRAPRWWQVLGLEWLYRVYQEPQRMWKRYLLTNTRFLKMLLRELFAARRGA